MCVGARRRYPTATALKVRGMKSRRTVQRSFSRLMYLGFILLSFGFMSPFVHLVRYALDQGIEPDAAASLMVFVGITNLTSG